MGLQAGRRPASRSNIREDGSRLAACIDSKASLSRVEAARQEGEDLGVNKTPTTFVNGRIIVGLASQATFDKIIDEALVASTKTGTGVRNPTP